MALKDTDLETMYNGSLHYSKTDGAWNFESPHPQSKENTDILATILNQVNTLNKRVESFESLSKKVERLEKKLEERCSNCAPRRSLIGSSIERKKSNGGYDREPKDEFAVNPIAECHGEQ